ncbi:MAG: tetratricopeptide repeat protein [bacterium]|jgi:Flp pilus assembly protein TadD
MSPLRRIPLHFFISAFLAVMVVAIYWQVGSFPFILLDDEPLLLKNPALQGGLTMEGVRWAFTTDMDAGWIPLTWLSRMLDVTLFGMNAGGHHLVNVLLHLLNTLLLFRVLREATGKTWGSGFVAALFAVHPLHVESVAWVTERKDVLAAFFWMLSLGAYVRYAARPGAARYGAVVLFFALGLLSKPIVVTLPFVLLLLDYWPLRRLWPSPDSPDGPPSGFSPATPGRLVLEKLPLFFLSAAISVITYSSQKGIGAVTPFDSNPLWARAGNAVQSYVLYLRKAVWPSDLAIFYPHPGTNLVPWKTVAAGLVLCLATAWVIRNVRGRRWLAVGWFWYLGMLVPVIGLVQVGGNAMADRCAYLPMIGIYLIAAWGAGELAARFKVPDPATAAAAFVCLLALTTCAWVQAGYWRGSDPLFRRALEVTKENWLAHGSLGLNASLAGRDGEAEVHYREALRIRPYLPDVHNGLGEVLDRQGRTEEAIPNFREELRIQPRFVPAFYNLGVACYRTGKVEEAAACFRETLRILPDHPEAHNNLGVVLSDAGSDDEAIEHFRAALRVRPAYAEAHRNLGMALSRGGALAEATWHLREAVRLRPEAAETRNNLGVLLARQGAFPEAVSEFRETLRLKPDHEGARFNLDRAVFELEKAGRRGD